MFLIAIPEGYKRLAGWLRSSATDTPGIPTHSNPTPAGVVDSCPHLRFLAPAGRHVYSKRHPQTNPFAPFSISSQPQRSAMFLIAIPEGYKRLAGWLRSSATDTPGIPTQSNPTPAGVADSCPHLRFFTPAERHVYSKRHPHYQFQPPDQPLRPIFHFLPAPARATCL